MGPVGSGKSYHAVVRGLRKIERGGLVVANFPIKEDCKWSRGWHYWNEITTEKLIAFSVDKGFIGKESRCLLIIDEAGIMFNARDWQVAKETRDLWINWFSQSRKFGYDVVLVAQTEIMIDKQIREGIEYLIRHRMLNRYWYFSWLPFKVFAVSEKWYKTNVPAGFPELMVLVKKYANLYDSMRLFNMDKVVEFLVKWYKGVVLPSHVLVWLTAMGYSVRDGVIYKGEKKIVKVS